MSVMTFDQAVEEALAQAMAEDDRILVWGEDVQLIHKNLFVRFGPDRILNTPISESAFLSAGVGAAMAGLRPVVEIMLVDFIGVAVDALLNHAAKTLSLSGGRWPVPLVVWTNCGGGYGDGGQHEQSLWGWLAHIPGLAIVVPSNPADAGALMLSALRSESPVVFFQHKLLSSNWLEFLGSGGRKTVSFDIPEGGWRGPVPRIWQPLPFGKAAVVRPGTDVTLVSVAVGVHRALEAAHLLEQKRISAEVIDLRTLVPLDLQVLKNSVGKTGKLVVIDEDYEPFGLSGELVARLLEENVAFTFRRVCTKQTIPFNRQQEAEVLPNTKRIVAAVLELM